MPSFFISDPGMERSVQRCSRGGTVAVLRTRRDPGRGQGAPVFPVDTESETPAVNVRLGRGHENP